MEDLSTQGADYADFILSTRYVGDLEGHADAAVAYLKKAVSSNRIPLAFAKSQDSQRSAANSAAGLMSSTSNSSFDFPLVFWYTIKIFSPAFFVSLKTAGLRNIFVSWKN